MPKLPVLTAKKIFKILQAVGFEIDHTAGSHYVFYHPESKNRVVVPFHTKDLAKGTIHSILRSAGLLESNK